MGIPYSKQINDAFDQVTPLVAEGFKVLETTKNISILLAAIQVLTVILLLFIFATLLALLITCNPDLVHERQRLVTPVLRWFSAWLLDDDARAYLVIVVVVICLGTVAGGAAGFVLISKTNLEDRAANQKELDTGRAETVDRADGEKDVGMGHP